MGLAVFCCMPTTLSSGVTLTQVQILDGHMAVCHASRGCPAHVRLSQHAACGWLQPRQACSMPCMTPACVPCSKWEPTLHWRCCSRWGRTCWASSLCEARKPALLHRTHTHTGLAGDGLALSTCSPRLYLLHMMSSLAVCSELRCAFCLQQRGLPPALQCGRLHLSRSRMPSTAGPLYCPGPWAQERVL